MKALKTFVRLIAGFGLIAGLLVAPAPVAAHENGDSLSAVRHATAKFHSVGAAHTAGYFDPGLPCFDKPGVGGMGTHLVNLALVNGLVSATQPQALVYEVDGDELTLVAVEYLVPISFDQPHLFGHAFHPAYLPHGGPALGLWELHAWVWRHNPLGMFADYNPRVDLCPGTPTADD
jgi:hypothetical protein